MHAACRNVQTFASNSVEAYIEAIKALHQLNMRLQSIHAPSTVTNHVIKTYRQPNRIQDPLIVLTKGAPRQPKRTQQNARECSRCSKPGHTIRTCSQKVPHCPIDLDNLSQNFFQASNQNVCDWTNVISNSRSKPAPSNASDSCRYGSKTNT